MASSSEAFDLSATVRVVARQLRENVEIKDRTYHLRTYKVNKAFLLRDASTAERKRLQQFIRFGKACFIGSEAVAWMLSSGVASNEAEAVQLGNMLLQEKLIAHVLEEHTFENGFFFYRFTAENQEARKEEASRSKPNSLAGSSPVLFFIHGMWGSPKYWSKWRAFFEGEGYKVITPALRYHTGSADATPDPALGNLSILEFADDLAKELEALDVKPVLVGHSMGGLLVQMLAAKGLAAAAVLVSPAPPSDVLGLTKSGFLTYVEVTGKWGFWHQVQKLSFEKARYGCLNCMPEERAVEEYQDFRWESGRSAFEIGFALLDKAHASKVDTAKVACPMLVVAGQEDNILPPSVTSKVAEKYKQALYRSYPKHGHWIMIEEGWQGQVGWKAVATDVLSWLREQSARLQKLKDQATV